MKNQLIAISAVLAACYIAALLPLPGIVYAVMGVALASGVAVWGVGHGL